MDSMEQLRRTLERLDGKPYPAYKDLRGRYRGDWGELSVDRVQGDPFAAPSRISVRLSSDALGLDPSLREAPSRRTGAENFLAETLARELAGRDGRSGSGSSGLLRIDRPGQEMLRRTCVEIVGPVTVLRLSVGLPAQGRRILGRQAADLLADELPAELRCLFPDRLDPEALWQWAQAAEDADHLRGELADRGWVAFVADGAVLPRRSGVDERPLEGAVPFVAPSELRAEVDLPHAGRVAGMALPEGVTLLAGGGYHGKSTLLRALERGVYNHRPGDGRERVVTRADAVKVRAEDGRAVTGVDLRPFINDLPGGVSTESFTTTNASGSTSQAASILEAMEVGARVLLLDEDISATNFLIRDARMQRLVAEDREPITPLVQRVRELHDAHGVSTLLVLGGSGDYFPVADRILVLDQYRVYDRTAEAHALAAGEVPGPPRRPAHLPPAARVPDPASIRPEKEGGRGRGGRPPKRIVRGHDTRGLTLGGEEIDLSLVAQLVDPAQVRAIGGALVAARDRGILDGRRTLAEAAQALEEWLEEEGLSVLPGEDLAGFRPLEWVAALNRLRGLQLRAGP